MDEHDALRLSQALEASRCTTAEVVSAFEAFCTATKPGPIEGLAALVWPLRDDIEPLTHG